MSELKRVSFTTLSGGPLESIASNSSKKSSFSSAAAALLQGQHDPFTIPGVPDPAASTSSDPVTSQQNISKTFRLDLELFESNLDSFPEFNYSKLVHLEKKKFKKLSKLNGVSDPFEENDDEVARIAKELEKKYGSTYGGGRRKSKRDDYYDKGAGYDESDSFIDNTEAYDEIIPEEIETVEGGFYINSGQLEFKHLSNYERPDDPIKMPKVKKRTLSTSSSSGEDSEGEEEAEAETEGNLTPKETNPTSTANKLKNGHTDKKQKVNETDRENGKNKTKDKRPDKVKGREDLKEDDVCSDLGKEKEKEKTVKTTTVKDMLKAKRDSFRKMQEGEGKVKLTNGESVKNSQSNNASSESSGDDSESEDEPAEKKLKKIGDEDSDKMRNNDVKLSEDLPEELLRDIQEMKTFAKMICQTGKPFSFDDKITEVFLRVDDACLCFDRSVRNQVFAHLEFQLSLPKYFLLRKAKQLRIKQEKTKTKKAYMKLKKAVAEIMPSVELVYESNCKKFEDMRAKILPEELEKMEHPPKYPKRRFPWSETLRNLLYELYKVRWMSFTVLGTKKEKFEDFVDNYLRDKVVPIWPNGWMKFDDLRKELDKRKKPKENKKPVDLPPNNKNKLNDETSISIIERPPEGTKSILSSSNSMSVVSTKDLVVTITTKSSEKLSEVPILNTQSNSVSITQIPAETIGTKEQSNSILGKPELKTHKSSSGSSVSCSRPCPLPPILEENLKFSKSVSQNSASGSSSYGKGSSKSNVEKKSYNSSSVNNHHKSVNPTNISSKIPLDLVSPTKRATDHSINSIMSTAPPSPAQHSGTAVHGLPSSTIMSSATTNKSLDPAITTTTHVITVDNLKNASEIINTTNQLLNNNNSTNNALCNNANSTSQKECPIRIRSVANVNSSVEKDFVLSDFNKPLRGRSDQESSSESDGVEIVGVYPVVTKKSMNVTVNKNKYVKSGSRSGSPNQISAQNLKSAPKIKVPQNEGRRNAEHVIISGEKDPELDVNQIMRALKELEEMQQSSIHISGGSPPSSSSRSATNSHTSPISYGKDIKQ